MIIEVCAGSYTDCINAYKGKANRVELNSALHLGGLTPSVATLRQVKKDTDLDVICMVRNRGAGFCYSEDEMKIMLEDAKILLENGADGIVFGCLTANRSVNMEYTKKMVSLIHDYEKKAVFHKAIDVCADYESGLKDLIACGVDRVLTSAQEKTAWDGKDKIKFMIGRYGDKIEILPGGSIHASNAKAFVDYTGTNQIHSSCKGVKRDITTTYNKIGYGYLKDLCAYECVDLGCVQDLVRIFEDE